MKRYRHAPGMSLRERPLEPYQVERLIHGHSLPDKLTNERLIQARQENAMPDIKTALTTALEEGKRKFLTATITDWDKHEEEIRTQQPTQPQPRQEKPMFQTTGHLTKDTFNYIKLNSGKVNGPQVVSEFEKLGSNAGSISAILTQLKGAGLIKRSDDSMLFAIADEYSPACSKYKQKIKADRKAAITAKRLATLARKKALVEKAAADRGEYEAKREARAKSDTITVSATNGIAALQPAPVQKIDVEAVLNNMSIVEARKLYDELKKLFS